mgnify:FL=1
MSQHAFFCKEGLPNYKLLSPASINLLISKSIDEGRKTLREVCTGEGPRDWENTIKPISEIHETINRIWGAANHLCSVADNPEIRDVINKNLEQVSSFWTDFSQNKTLYKIFANLRRGISKTTHPHQHKILCDYIRDFELAGANLEDDAQLNFKKNTIELNRLAQKFSENLLDSTKETVITVALNKDKKPIKSLEGIPKHVLELSKKEAKKRHVDGYVFSLQPPIYSPIIEYSSNRSLRFDMFCKYARRSSDIAEEGSLFDNSLIIAKILKLRYHQAKILGFSNPAELSLATKMADSPENVVIFLKELAAKAKPFAQKELDKINHYSNQIESIRNVEPWDIPFLSEKLKKSKFAIDNEELRNYFPLSKVLSGLFETVKDLFGCEINREQEYSAEILWEDSVQIFKVVSEGQTTGYFFFDLFSREEKRGGAWMDECRSRIKHDNEVQTPIALMNCNFSQPIAHEDVYLTHDEVVTLFHEFGHGLHHLLTEIDYLEISGISGVEWDAVELPSQFLENFAWEYETLKKISKHRDTGLPINKEIFGKIYAAKNFNSGLQMIRQIEFALFDILIHKDLDGCELLDDNQVYKKVLEILEIVRREISVIKQPSFVLFPNSFSHIFDGGYAAGYYSYKWAEVLSSDCYARFEGKNDREKSILGDSFKKEILSKGGSREAIASFRAFMGREPKPDAMFKHLGLVSF